MAPRKSKKNFVPKLQASDLIQLPDLAAILEQLATPLIDEDDDETFDKAKGIFYKACEAPSKQRRIALAKKQSRSVRFVPTPTSFLPSMRFGLRMLSLRSTGRRLREAGRRLATSSMT
jgi:hypothetical protein